MSAEENRQIVLKYFQLMYERNKPFAEELLADDCKWWAPGGGVMDKATFSAMVEQMRPIMPKLPKLHILGTTAEGDRVAVEAKGEGTLANGKPYENLYHFLVLLRNGRICMVQEHCDSKYAADTFSS
jgi:ketosteroid isomerase-like protein